MACYLIVPSYCLNLKPIMTNHYWGSLTIDWGQFDKRHLCQQSLDLTWKLLTSISLKSPKDQWVDYMMPRDKRGQYYNTFRADECLIYQTKQPVRRSMTCHFVLKTMLPHHISSAIPVNLLCMACKCDIKHTDIQEVYSQSGIRRFTARFPEYLIRRDWTLKQRFCSKIWQCPWSPCSRGTCLISERSNDCNPISRGPWYLVTRYNVAQWIEAPMWVRGFWSLGKIVSFIYTFWKQIITLTRTIKSYRRENMNPQIGHQRDFRFPSCLEGVCHWL